MPKIALIAVAKADVPVVAPVVPVVKPTPSISQSSVKTLVLTAAKAVGVNPTKINYIAEKESNFDPTRIGDKDFVCNLPASPLFNQPSPSYGVFQINRCAHPEVSIQNALDPVFASQWAAKQIAEGNADIWSAWRLRKKLYQDFPF